MIFDRVLPPIYLPFCEGALRIPTLNAVPGTGILANILAMLSEISDIGEGIPTSIPIIGEDLAPKKVSQEETRPFAP